MKWLVNELRALKRDEKDGNGFLLQARTQLDGPFHQLGSKHSPDAKLPMPQPWPSWPPALGGTTSYTIPPVMVFCYRSLSRQRKW